MDEFKIGDDIEETPGTSRIRKENKIIPIIIVVIVAIAIGLGVFFISNSILNPKKKEVKDVVICLYRGSMHTRQHCRCIVNPAILDQL